MSTTGEIAGKIERKGPLHKIPEVITYGIVPDGFIQKSKYAPENSDKKKKRLQPWDNCKRSKFGGHFPHPGGRLTPFSGVNHLVSRCPTLSIARTAPPIPASRQNANTQ
jgi:hypothetical protein